MKVAECTGEASLKGWTERQPRQLFLHAGLYLEGDAHENLVSLVIRTEEQQNPKQVQSRTPLSCAAQVTAWFVWALNTKALRVPLTSPLS